MRVVVTGGRDFCNRVLVFDALNALNPKPTCVAQGGARGADALALEWAVKNQIPCMTFEADWKKQGRCAGPQRNRRMLDEFKPDLVVAFPGGPGTANCVGEAIKRGVRVLEVKDQ